jgi:hypothetical protein
MPHVITCDERGLAALRGGRDAMRVEGLGETRADVGRGGSEDGGEGVKMARNRGDFFTPHSALERPRRQRDDRARG